MPRHSVGGPYKKFLDEMPALPEEELGITCPSPKRNRVIDVILRDLERRGPITRTLEKLYELKRKS